MDTTKSLLACGIATALALSQSIDEQQQAACVAEPLTGSSAAASCYEKPAAAPHIEPGHVGPHPFNAIPGLAIPGLARPGVGYYGPEPAAFVQPMRGDLIVTDPTSYAPSA
jgi:hypothetical protein